MARARAAALGLADRLELLPWRPASELADIYRGTHVVLVPSRPTTTWVEQFGRVIVEGAGEWRGRRRLRERRDPRGRRRAGDTRERRGGRGTRRSRCGTRLRRSRLHGSTCAGDRAQPHADLGEGRRPPGRPLPTGDRRRRSAPGAAVIATQAARARPRRVRSDRPDESRRETIRSPAAAARRASAGSSRPAARCGRRARLALRKARRRVRSTGPRDRRRATSPRCARV